MIIEVAFPQVFVIAHHLVFDASRFDFFSSYQFEIAIKPL
jgi:hypothetical protein